MNLHRPFASDGLFYVELCLGKYLSISFANVHIVHRQWGIVALKSSFSYESYSRHLHLFSTKIHVDPELKLYS